MEEPNVFKARKDVKSKALAAYVIAMLDDEVKDDAKVTYVVTSGRGIVDTKSALRSAFAEAHIGVNWGMDPYDPLRVVDQMFAEGVKFSQEALDIIERILHMDTRGKTIEQIRAEIVRLAGQLPKGHSLSKVPASFSDRGAAIAALTAVRQAIFQSSKSTQENSMAAKGKKGTTETTTTSTDKPAATEAEATKGKGKGKAAGTKASGAGKDVAAAAAKKGKPKADFNGKYKTAGEAAKAKSTEELGMHEESVRTKVLAVVMSSKAEGGVDYSKLEAAAGDKTRGAVAYLLKRGFLVRAAA